METELTKLRIDRGQRATVAGTGRKSSVGAWLVFVLLACGVGLSSLFAYRSHEAPTEVQVYRAKYANAVRANGPDGVVLDATGYIVAAHKIEVASKVPGKVAWIGADKGQKVEQGQILVRLEDQEYYAHVVEAEGNLDVLKAKLLQLQHGSRPQEIAKARADFASSKTDLENYRLALDRTRKLVSEGISARQTLDDAKARYDAQAEKVASLEQTYRLIELGPREEEIAAVQGEIRQVNGGLTYAKTLLDSTIIRAPVTGTVLDRNVEKGEFVTTGFVGDKGAKGYVVSMADLSDLQVELDIDQNNFAKLKLAQPAVVTTDAYPDRKYIGRIVEISPEANRMKASIQIKVKVENPDEYLRPEMNASVSFRGFAGETGVAAQPSMSVIVPPSAVRDGAVFVAANSRAVRKTVVPEGTTPEGLVIARGLMAGEEVIVSPPYQLQDGDKIRVNEAKP